MEIMRLKDLVLYSFDSWLNVRYYSANKAVKINLQIIRLLET
jgi:hypothetical protein